MRNRILDIALAVALTPTNPRAACSGCERKLPVKDGHHYRTEWRDKGVWEREPYIAEHFLCTAVSASNGNGDV